MCSRLNIKQIVDEEMNAANQQMAFGITSLVLVLMISPIIIVLVRHTVYLYNTQLYIILKHESILLNHNILCKNNFLCVQVRSATATIQIFSLSLSKKALELKNEKGKAKSLLFETLPKHIASEYTQVHGMKQILSNANQVTKLSRLFLEIIFANTYNYLFFMI
jgi:hypothetical protein